MYVGTILLIFKIEEIILEEKDWLKRMASCSDMSWKALNSTWDAIPLLSTFKEEIMLETSVVSVGVNKNDSIFKGGR